MPAPRGSLAPSSAFWPAISPRAQVRELRGRPQAASPCSRRLSAPREPREQDNDGEEPGQDRADEPEESGPSAAEGPPFRAIALEADGPRPNAPFGQGAAIAAHRALTRGARARRLLSAKGAPLRRVVAVVEKLAGHRRQCSESQARGKRSVGEGRGGEGTEAALPGGTTHEALDPFNRRHFTLLSPNRHIRRVLVRACETPPPSSLLLASS